MFAHFRALGWEVTSMEPDADFHQAATSAALESRYPAPSERGFLEIDFSNRFDLVTAINDPFAHMLTGDDKADALRRVHRALKPAGVVMLDVPNFLWILKNYRAPEPVHASTEGGAVTLRREHHIDFHSAVFTTIEHYELVHDGESRRSSKTHAYSMSTLPELTFHLREAGFVNQETYASWDARNVERIDGSTNDDFSGARLDACVNRAESHASRTYRRSISPKTRSIGGLKAVALVSVPLPWCPFPHVPVRARRVEPDSESNGHQLKCGEA